MSQIPNFFGLLEDPLHRAADASAVLSSAFEVTAYLTVMRQHSEPQDGTDPPQLSTQEGRKIGPKWLLPSHPYRKAWNELSGEWPAKPGVCSMARSLYVKFIVEDRNIM